MKKILSFLFVGLVALGMFSCKPKPEEPENKEFTILVDSITSTTAYVKVTPADAAQLYFWSVFDTKDVATAEDNAILTDISELIDDYIAYYQTMGYEVTVFDFLDKGESFYKFETLSPTTDYTVCAVKFDNNGKPFGEVAKKNFSTPKMEIIGNENLKLNGYYESHVETDGYYNLEAMTDDDKYYLYLSPDVNSLSDNLTMANFVDPEYLYFAVGEGEFTIVELDLKASLANGILTLKGTFVASNGIKYATEIVAEEDQTLGGAPAKKMAPRATIKPLQKVRMVKGLR